MARRRSHQSASPQAHYGYLALCVGTYLAGACGGDRRPAPTGSATAGSNSGVAGAGTNRGSATATNGTMGASGGTSASGGTTASSQAETSQGGSRAGTATGVTSASGATAIALGSSSVITPSIVQQYVDEFNGFDDTEQKVVNAIPNAQAAAWITDNVPLFECSDKSVEEMYYYRWWTYRKNIKNTASGYIITEFLFDVGWAGLDNSIDDAAGHHFYEGRWISNRQYLQDYATFWLRVNAQGALSYSNWIPAGIYAAYLVDGNSGFISNILPDTVTLYQNAEHKWLDAARGLYHIVPDRDAMEDPISGTGDQYRPSINGYAYGNAVAISRMASLAGNTAVAEEFATKASAIQAATQNALWDKSAAFFKSRLLRYDDVLHRS